MQTTDLTTKEADLNIVYGPNWKPDKPKELNLASVKYIFTDMTDIRRHYIRLGFHLNEFDNRLGYWDFGFATLYDFCEANLGLDKGAVSRCINVYREFNAKDDCKRIGNYESHGRAMDLSERWKDYSYTQLCEMLPLTEDQRKKLTPDMTVKQIREYKKNLRNEERKSKELDKSLKLLDEVIQKSKDSVASTQPEDLPDDTSASTQFFDYVEWMNKTGIVRYNYVKKCDPICESDKCKSLQIFDSRGKEVILSVPCDILQKNDGNLVIRIYESADPLKFDSAD